MRSRAELGRQVAVAEMPGEAHQLCRARRCDLGQRLRRGAHRDDPPVLQLQAVAVAERHRLGEVEQKFEAARAVHGHPAAVALVIVEHHGIGRSLAATVPWQEYGWRGSSGYSGALAIPGIFAKRQRIGQIAGMRGILFDKDGTLLDFEETWTPVLKQLALEAARATKPARPSCSMRAGSMRRRESSAPGR